jgi:hypothetical protein
MDTCPILIEQKIRYKKIVIHLNLIASYCRDLRRAETKARKIKKNTENKDQILGAQNWQAC